MITVPYVRLHEDLESDRISTNFLPAATADARASERASARAVAVGGAASRMAEQSMGSLEREARRQRCGLMIYAAATVLVSSSIISYKLATEAGVTIQFVVFFRCSSSLSVCLVVCWIRGIPPLGYQRFGLLARGFFGALSMALQAYASSILPTAIVAIISVGLQPAATTLR